MDDFKSKIVANQQLIFILIATACFIGLAYYVYITYVAKGDYIPNKEFSDITDTAEHDDPNKNFERVDLYFFWASWCPHSLEAKTVWDKFAMDGSSSTPRIYKNKYKIYYNSIQCDESNASKVAAAGEMMDKYNIEGYPTIILQHGTDVIEYNAKPNIDTLSHFISNTLV